jgi:hypothetical protein
MLHVVVVAKAIKEEAVVSLRQRAHRAEQGDAEVYYNLAVVRLSVVADVAFRTHSLA